jgi:hypothetical protein
MDTDAGRGGFIYKEDRKARKGWKKNTDGEME